MRFLRMADDHHGIRRAGIRENIPRVTTNGTSERERCQNESRKQPEGDAPLFTARFFVRHAISFPIVLVRRIWRNNGVSPVGSSHVFLWPRSPPFVMSSPPQASLEHRPLPRSVQAGVELAKRTAPALRAILFPKRSSSVARLGLVII